MPAPGRKIAAFRIPHFRHSAALALAAGLALGVIATSQAAYTDLANVKAVAMGDNHTCAIAGAIGQEKAYCWGVNGYGQLGDGTRTDSPSPLEVGGLPVPVKSISAGSQHTCAVAGATGSERVYCWGSNTNAQLGVTTGPNTCFFPSDCALGPRVVTTDNTNNVASQLTGATQVGAGALHTCAVVSGGVRCWGERGQGRLGNGSTVSGSIAIPTFTIGSGQGVTAVAGGNQHTCALLGGTGEVRCWGGNGSGQVGDNSTTARATPFSLSTGGPAATLALGSAHSCAVVNGALRCWGDNNAGQMGNGGLATGPLVPTTVTAFASGVTAVGTGHFNTCAVVAGALRCWGDNDFQQSDASATSPLLNAPASPRIASGVVAVAGGANHTCAIVGTTLSCFGRNGNGQAGTGSGGFATVPLAALPIASGAAFLSTGAQHACAIVGGQPLCWGANANGQLGNGTTLFSPVPVAPSGIASGTTSVAAGANHSCAVVNGGVKCWGLNANGQLGNNSTASSSVPVDVLVAANPTPVPLNGALAVTAGSQHACALLSQSGAVRVFCWGGNGSGQLGDNSTSQRLVATQTFQDTTLGATKVAAGGFHTCARMADGSARCWGENGSGQAGNPFLISDILQPTAVPDFGAGVTDLSAGGSHTCIVASGTVFCFGANGTGQLGTAAGVPFGFRVAAVNSGATAIAAGSAHTCAIVGGAVQCWGDNTRGQLGNGTFTNSSVAVAALASAGATAIAAGTNMTCAVIGGGITCFGGGESGELGVARYAAVTAPTTTRIGFSSATSVLPAANPAIVGQPVTLTAALVLNTTSPAPAGTIAFRDGGATIAGCGAVAFAGTGLARFATCTTSTLPLGTRSITAEYSGDANYVASASAALPLAVVSTTPTGLAFGDQVNVPLGTFATSNAVAIAGIGIPVPISVAGGQYSIGCNGTFTSAPGTISNGQAVCVRHLTPLALATTTTTTLTVGAGSAAFTTVTRLDSPDTPPADLAAGTSHNLVITPNGQVWGWGDNTAGKLGSGNTTSTTIPVRAGTLTGVISVATGMAHSLALKSDGTVWAWGLNAFDQLGIGPSSPANCTVDNDFGPGPSGTFGCALQPVQVPGLSHVVQVAAGWRQSFAVTKDGSLWSWGGDDFGSGYGLTGDGGGAELPAKVNLPGPVRRVAAGYMHTAVLLESGEVYVWGRARQGERGSATLQSCPVADQSGPTPTLVPGLTNVTDLAAGGGFTVARLADGSLVAWGNNVYGALGDASVSTGSNGSSGCRPTPLPVPGMTNVAAFSAGFGFVVAKNNDGTFWAWGLNNNGQLGSGTAPDLCGRNGANPLDPLVRRPCVRTPSNVALQDGALRIAAGGGHTITVRPGGSFVNFGDNAEGQLGDKSGNFGASFLQTTYDPDFSLVPAGTFGSPSGVGRPGTAGALNLSTLGEGLAFAGQGIGTPSQPLVLTLQNLSESDDLLIGSIAAAGDAVAGEFTATDACPRSPAVLPAGQGCDISITFTPSAFGVRTGRLTVISDAPDSPSVEMAMTGDGVDARAPTSLAVASSAQTSILGNPVALTATLGGTSSAGGSVLFRDGGVPITGCTAAAVASLKATCMTAALPVGVRQITADYSGDSGNQPSSSGVYNQVVVATAAPIAANPASLDFGGQSINTTAPGQAVTLTNTGASTLTVNSLTASAGFGVTQDCTALAASAFCTATITFMPAAEGVLNGTITVDTNAGIQVIAVTGVGERSLVTHYYQAILRRAPDAGGKAFWESERLRMLSLGANVNETWYAMATFFFFSAEYASFNRDNTGFVTDLYNTFFNRGPDPGGLAFWTGQLSQGMPREVVLVSFMFSNEFQAFTQAIFGNTQVRREIDTVVDFYRGLLSRLPDSSGFAFWVAQFRAAQCAGANAGAAVYQQAESISGGFANSAEYAARNRTNAQYVGDLYNAFLRRGGDLGGVQFWINEIATGSRTRDKVRQDFIASPEFNGRVLAIIAQGCLP